MKNEHDQRAPSQESAERRRPPAPIGAGLRSAVTPPPDVDAGPPAPSAWPTGAKVIVAVLAVVAVLASIGAAIGFSSGDDGSSERELQERVTTLIDERDDALDSVGALDVELAALQQQLDAAEAGNDELNGSIGELETRIVTLTSERADALAVADVLTATVDDLTGTVDELTTNSDVLEAALATAQQRLAAATAERDAFAKLFPMKFDASLGNRATVGTHDVRLSQVFCSGLASCGKAPVLDDVTISANSKGHLRLAIPKFVEGGLFEADGALHMVADSTTAITACDGTARTARVAMTIFPGSYEIGADGARSITGLNAVVTVEAAATGSCPAALAFYTATLT